MFHVVFCILLIVVYIKAVADQLPLMGKRELICLLSFTCNYVVSVRRGFLFLWVLEMGCDILLWHSLSLPCNYFAYLASYSNTCYVQTLWLIWVNIDSCQTNRMHSGNGTVVKVKKNMQSPGTDATRTQIQPSKP